MANRDTAATLEYHEATKHRDRSVGASRHFLDFENQPLAFKIKVVIGHREKPA